MDRAPSEVVTDTCSLMKLDVTKVILAVVTFFYGTGYLIQAISLRNYGIHRLETVKLQYIEVGVTFTVLTLLLTVVPVACGLAHLRIRRKSGLLHYRIGAFGYFANTCNLFFLVVCFALFFTQDEWSTEVLLNYGGGVQLRLSEVFFIYAVLSVFVLVVLPLVERSIVARVRRRKLVYAVVVEPFRYSAVLLGVAFDVLILQAFPWIRLLLLQGLTFWASAICLVATLYVVVFYIRKLGDNRTGYILAALGTTGVFVLLYMCINAYVFAIVRHIPMNRGGKLPLTWSYLVTDDKSLGHLPVARDEDEGCIIWGPVYVVEETEDYLHIAKASGSDWFKKWVQTFSIKKDTVQYITHERIAGKGPRRDASE